MFWKAVSAICVVSGPLARATVRPGVDRHRGGERKQDLHRGVEESHPAWGFSVTSRSSQIAVSKETPQSWEDVGLTDGEHGCACLLGRGHKHHLVLVHLQVTKVTQFSEATSGGGGG